MALQAKRSGSWSETPAEKMTFSDSKLAVLKEEFFPVHEKAWSKKMCEEICVTEDFTRHYFYYMAAGSRDKIIAGPFFIGHDEISFERAAELVKEKQNFLNVIKQFRPESFKEMLFLSDVYNECIRDWLFNFDYYHANEADESAFSEIGLFIEKRIAEVNGNKLPSSAKHAALCEILAESNGLLLWGYQLELIIGLFVSDRDEIVALRKGFNAKNPEALKRLGRMRVDSKTSLRRFIMARLLFSYGCVPAPNLKGALDLYNALR